MRDEELKLLWHNGAKPEIVKLDDVILLNTMSNKLAKFDKDIKARDNREIAAFIILMPIFAVIAWFVPNWLSKAGALLILPWSVISIYILRSVKKYRTDDPSLPFYDYLVKYRLYIQKEKYLLDTVLWWYVLPCGLACGLFFAGFSRWEGLIMVAAVCAGVWWINYRTIKKYFTPLLQNLDEQIRELEY